MSYEAGSESLRIQRPRIVKLVRNRHALKHWLTLLNKQVYDIRIEKHLPWDLLKGILGAVFAVLMLAAIKHPLATPIIPSLKAQTLPPFLMAPDRPYSHSIVPGGLLVMSYVTRLIPRTSFTIRVATRARNSMLNG